jgi:ferrous-iron efflux pump FieF
VLDWRQALDTGDPALNSARPGNHDLPADRDRTDGTVADDASGHALMRAASMASPVVATVLIALKTWGWSETDSVALLGSLADSLLDLAASLITFFAVRVALVPPDDRHRFGHGKSEAVAGVAQALLIGISSVVVVFEALHRVASPVPVSAPRSGLAVILVSLLLTGLLVAFQRYVSARTQSQAIAADEAHYRMDLLVGVLVGGAVLASAQPGLWWIDPATGALVSAYLVHTATGIARRALRDLLDEELPEVQRARIREVILARDHVRGLHDLRTRSAGAHRFVQVHVELDPDLPLARAHEIGADIEQALRREYAGLEVLIHLDPAGGAVVTSSP